MQTLKKLAGPLCGFLVGALLGAVLGIYMLSAPSLGLPGMLALLAGLCLAFYAQLLLHEAGHLVFGLLTGYRFVSFRIGSVMLVRRGGRLRLSRYALAGTAGQCLLAPPPMADGAYPVVLYNLGGVLMNLLTALAALLLAPFVPMPWNAAPVLLALTGLGTAVLNGVPLGGPVDNDGKNTLALCRDPAARRAFWVQLSVNAALAGGRRLREMPAEWFVCPPDDGMRGALTAALGVFCCNRLLDEHRFAEAATQIDRLLALDTGMLDLHRAMLLCDREFLALIAADGTQAPEPPREQKQARQLAQLEKAMKSNPSVLRTQYARALLGQNRPDRAQKYRAAFEKTARRYPYPQEIEAERELLALADAKADGRAPAP